MKDGVRPWSSTRTVMEIIQISRLQVKVILVVACLEARKTKYLEVCLRVLIRNTSKCLKA